VRIGYVTIYDSSEVNEWSGLGYFIRRCLAMAGASVEPIGPLEPCRSLPVAARRLFYRFVKSGTYLRQRDAAAGRHYARQVEAHLATTDVDLVFSPGTIPIAYLSVPKPVVFWTDATFAAMRDYYPGFGDLAQVSIEAGERMERSALALADLALFASEWAAASAINDYGVDPAKVKVIPFGANLEHGWTPIDVSRAIDARPADRCRLLFIGIDWTRKGGAVAVQVAKELNSRGLQTELTVVGSNPALSPGDESFVQKEGFIDKSSAEGSRRIQSLLAKAHFLILPSRAECYGLALCEANAFGVPCLATRVGGIPTIVKDDVNGMLFPVDANPSVIADYVLSTVQNIDNYRRLARSSYEEYRTRLNWVSSGQRVMSLLSELTEIARPSAATIAERM